MLLEFDVVGRFTRHRSGHDVSGLALAGKKLLASGGWGDKSIWLTDFKGGSKKTLSPYVPQNQRQGLAFSPQGTRLAATASREELMLFNLSGDHCTLAVTEKSWVAVAKDGRFQGDAALHSKAKREHPTLLAEWFAT